MGKGMKVLNWARNSLAGVGALNWALVGLANYNLIETIFGMTWFTRVLYVLAGVSGIWIFIMQLMGKK